MNALDELKVNFLLRLLSTKFFVMFRNMLQIIMQKTKKNLKIRFPFFLQQCFNCKKQKNPIAWQASLWVDFGFA
jgi:hypothetical protein